MDSSNWGKEFREHIQQYNAALAFTSVGCKLDPKMQEGGGPYSFRIQNELHHNDITILEPYCLIQGLSQSMHSSISMILQLL